MNKKTAKKWWAFPSNTEFSFFEKEEFSEEAFGSSFGSAFHGQPKVELPFSEGCYWIKAATGAE
jgi:hypothetical protein